MKHKTNLGRSERLQVVLNLLIDKAEHTTLEIQRLRDSMSPSSEITDLRALGFDIKCRRNINGAKTGPQISAYRLLSVPDNLLCQN